MAKDIETKNEAALNEVVAKATKIVNFEQYEGGSTVATTEHEISRFYDYKGQKGYFLVTESTGVPVLKYTNLLITAIDDTRQDKVQIVETATDVSVVYLGVHPDQIYITANLLNTVREPWRDQFKEYYNKYFSIKALASNNWKLYLVIDTLQMLCIMTGYKWTQVATSEGKVTLNFSLLVPQGGLRTLLETIREIAKDKNTYKTLSEADRLIVDAYMNKINFAV